MSTHQSVADGESTGAPLRLLAFDVEDLAIVSASLQDAVVQPADMAWQKQTRRFVLALARFDWEAVASGRKERCGTGLHFDYVRLVTQTGFVPGQDGPPMNLLSIRFEASSLPAGLVVLTFSGAASIRLDVECLDAQMRDIGPRWSVDAAPGHVFETGDAG